MLTSALTFFAVLFILIISHELGHFLSAKKLGVKVLEFGFGIPPKLWGKKLGETIYSINWLPFGGFVRLFGEEGEETGTGSFAGKSKKARLLVIVAGVLSNLILSVVVFSVVYWVNGIPRASGQVKVLEVVAESPAQVAGILAGDKISFVDGQSVSDTTSFIAAIDEKKGKKVKLVLERDGGEKNITITPRAQAVEGQGPLGVVISSSEIYYPPYYARPFWGVYFGFKESVMWGKNILGGLGNMFINLFRGEVPKGVTGPVGVAAVVVENARGGWLATVHLIGILSVNLAILNILPFPGLDGGRALFIALESVIKRKTLRKFESYFHTIGMYLLLLLLLVITFVDVKKLIVAGSLSGFLESMLQ